MRIFTIKPGFINKVVGWVAAHKMRDSYAPDAGKSVVNLKPRGPLEFIPDLDGIQLLSRAKPLDLISAIPVSSSGLLMSESLIIIVRTYKYPDDVQVFPAVAYQKDKKYQYYYFYQPNSNEDKILDWDKCLFKEVSLGGRILSDDSFKLSYSQIIERFQTHDPILKTPVKLVFKEAKMAEDIFRLDFSYPGYFISERLKEAIEAADLKGVELVPIDQLGFEVEFI